MYVTYFWPELEFKKQFLRFDIFTSAEEYHISFDLLQSVKDNKSNSILHLCLKHLTSFRTVSAVKPQIGSKTTTSISAVMLPIGTKTTALVSML